MRRGFFLLCSVFFITAFFIPRAVFGVEFNVTVTGYTSGRGARTATGAVPKFGTIAVSRDLLGSSLPHGACLEIPGVYPGRTFRVEDTMSKKWTNKIDIWVGSREEAVKKIGQRKNVAVKSVPCSSGSDEASEGMSSESGALYDPEHNAWIPLPTSVSCSLADINRDEQVDIADLVLVAKWFGNTVVPGAKEDLNQDGKVDIVDLVMVGREFGKKCSTTVAPIAPIVVSSKSEARGLFATMLDILFVLRMR